MDTGNEISNYGFFCLNHSKKFGGKTIDKLTFTVPKQFFKKNIFQYNEKFNNLMYYIERCHNQYFKLHIQGEFINPLIPMLYSVIEVFDHISNNKLFFEEFNQKLRKTISKCKDFNTASVDFIKFLNSNCFHFSELELAFDFFNYNPVIEVNNYSFRNYNDTYYTNDYKINYRKEFKEDDSYGYVKDGIRESILSIYNRGKKLKVNENVWRVEWRLRDIRSWRLLDLTDLRLSMDGFIYSKGNRLRNIYNNWVPKNSITFNLDYINNYFPIFSLLITG